MKLHAGRDTKEIVYKYSTLACEGKVLLYISREKLKNYIFVANEGYRKFLCKILDTKRS